MLLKLLRPLLWLTVAYSRLAWASVENITIDDSGYPIVYQPPDSWNTATFCTSGPGKCTASPDPTEMTQGTWHETSFISSGSEASSFPPSATLQFNGTAVYVFCALSRTVNDPPGNSDMSFYIDGSAVGVFQKPAPENSSGFEYGVVVYSNTTLQQGQHEIKIINGRANGPDSLIILDRIVYSVNTESVAEPSQLSSISTPMQTASVDIIPSQPPPILKPIQSASVDAIPTQSTSANIGRDHSTPPGVIIGVVIGSLGLCISVIAVLLYHRRHKRSMKIVRERTVDTPLVSQFYPSAGSVGSYQSSNPMLSNIHLSPFPNFPTQAAQTAERHRTTMAAPGGPDYNQHYLYSSQTNPSSDQHRPLMGWRVRGGPKCSATQLSYVGISRGSGSNQMTGQSLPSPSQARTQKFSPPSPSLSQVQVSPPPYD